MNKRKLTDYRPDPSNANQHSERGMSMLENSLSEVGLGRSIVTDKNGIILAGNATHERAVDQGFENAIEVETDGDELVVVKRRDLDLLNDPDYRARMLSVYDNRVQETSLTWNPEALEQYKLEGVPVGKVWSPVELNNVLQANADFDPSQEWQGMPEYEQDTLKPFHSFWIHLASEDAMRQFSELIEQTISLSTKYVNFPKPDIKNPDKESGINVDHWFVENES